MRNPAVLVEGHQVSVQDHIAADQAISHQVQFSGHLIQFLVTKNLQDQIQFQHPLNLVQRLNPRQYQRTRNYLILSNQSILVLRLLQSM